MTAVEAINRGAKPAGIFWMVELVTTSSVPVMDATSSPVAQALMSSMVTLAGIPTSQKKTASPT